MSFFKKKKEDKKGKEKKDPSKVAPVLAPPGNLEDELKGIWDQPIEDTPVFKDLPRLAQRMVVLGTMRKGDQERKNSTAPPPQPQKAEVLSSFTIYYNISNIESPRANEWPKTYKIQKLQLVKSDKIIIEFFDENEEKLASVPGSKVLAVEDSSRYFLMKDVPCLVPKETRNLGFAFYTREEAQTFLKVLTEDLKREIPIIRDMAQAPVLDDGLYETMPSETESGEKIIDEEELDDVRNEANSMIKQMGSAASNPEQFFKIRDSVNQRLSSIGSGLIRTKEEKRLSRMQLRSMIASSSGSNDTSSSQRSSSSTGVHAETEMSSTTTVSSSTGGNPEIVSVAITIDNKNVPIIMAVRRVVNEISLQVEKPEDYKRIVSGISKPEYDSYDGDMELLTATWINDVIGPKSVTAAILKACTQSIIHVCTYQVKARLPMNVLTGDVRGPEGWQIVILFAHDVINISHRRREKSLDAFGPQSEFWFEWVLNMCFNRVMSQLQSATLRISKLEFGKNIDPVKKDELRRLFCGGDLLIA